MKIINKITLTVSLIFVLAMYSCNDYLDVNEDPNRFSRNQVTLNSLLPTIIEATSAAQQSAALSAQRVTHQLDNVQAGYYQRFENTGAWNEIYLKCFNNISTMQDLAIEQNSPHYAAIATILKAVNMMLVTDNWEAAPVSQASQLSENITPAYDSQEKIYSSIMAELKTAITQLDQESELSPGSDDMIYGGDLEKWKKAAYGFMARAQLHTLGKGATASDAIASLGSSFDSTEEDFQLFYAENQTNPWFNSIAKLLTQSIATQTYGADFMNAMNGTEYGYFDPRLPLIAELNDGSTEYRGLASYIDDTDYTIFPTDNTYYMNSTGPNIILSYAELRFIEAEMLFNSGSIAEAKTVAEEGTRAHMTRLGVTPEDQDSYVNSAYSGALTLELIMKEKLIATVFNFEAWNDMRRHQFSSSVYPYFSEPDFLDRSEPAQRALYPSSEQTRNTTNYQQNLKEFTESMWKDQ